MSSLIRVPSTTAVKKVTTLTATRVPLALLELNAQMSAYGYKPKFAAFRQIVCSTPDNRRWRREARHPDAGPAGGCMDRARPWARAGRARRPS